jgi:hypothetical protein
LVWGEGWSGDKDGRNNAVLVGRGILWCLEWKGLKKVSKEGGGETWNGRPREEVVGWGRGGGRKSEGVDIILDCFQWSRAEEHMLSLLATPATGWRPTWAYLSSCDFWSVWAWANNTFSQNAWTHGSTSHRKMDQ